MSATTMAQTAVQPKNRPFTPTPMFYARLAGVLYLVITIAAIVAHRDAGRVHVLDADIEKCFDNIAREPLLDRLNAIRPIACLVRGWLKAGILDGDRIMGVITESKSGRQAILAKRVIDASGDADIFDPL